MKSIAYTIAALTSLLALVLSTPAEACWGPYISPREYSMYRGRPDLKNWSTPFDREHMCFKYNYNAGADDNCLLWKVQTGTDASVSEICEVVYKCSLDTLRMIASGKDPYNGTNFFSIHLLSDREALEFLLLAKKCEITRLNMSSVWFYPSKEDEDYLSLKEIVEKCKAETKKGGLYYNRYILQEMRALISLQEYEECVSEWKRLSPAMNDDIIRQLCYGYVAGAYESLADTSNALKYYAKSNDYRNYNRMGGNTDEMFSEYSLFLRDVIEGDIYMIDDRCWDKDGTITLDEYDEGLLRKYLPVCLKYAADKSVPDADFWLYTASYISYLLGDSSKAESLLAKAANSRGSQFIKDQIHIFRFWMEASRPYSQSYENNMAQHTSWLIGQMQKALPESLKDSWELNGILDIRSMAWAWDGEQDLPIKEYKAGYLNKMLVKILQAKVCPTLLSKGKYSSAIAFANLSNYAFLNMLDASGSIIGKIGNLESVRARRLSVSEAARSKDDNPYALLLDNGMDFQTTSFMIMDSIQTSYVIDYVRNMEKSQSLLYRMARENGYYDKDYLYDIVGTKLIRDLRYAEAEKYLESVPANYQLRLNTNEYLFRAPFSAEKESNPPVYDVKYSFARKMASLEKDIQKCKDPGRKALLMTEYATGMRNSMGNSWALAFYGIHAGDDTDTTSTLFKAQQKAFARAEELYSQALQICDDDNIKASLEFFHGNHSYVVEQFKGTQASDYIESHCDTWKDYHYEKPSVNWQGRYLQHMQSFVHTF